MSGQEKVKIPSNCLRNSVVGRTGFGPATFCTSSRCPNQARRPAHDSCCATSFRQPMYLSVLCSATQAASRKLPRGIRKNLWKKGKMVYLLCLSDCPLRPYNLHELREIQNVKKFRIPDAIYGGAIDEKSQLFLSQLEQAVSRTVVANSFPSQKVYLRFCRMRFRLTHPPLKRQLKIASQQGQRSLSLAQFVD
jgi:hypothetical protein